MFDLIKKNINLRSGIILLSLAIFFVFITNSFKKNKSKDISNFVVQVKKGILSDSINTSGEVKAIITLKISTKTDGTVRSVSIFDKTLYQKDKFFRATADAARRAVLDSSPLPLPKGKEKKFQNILMDFNTSFINDYWLNFFYDCLNPAL